MDTLEKQLKESGLQIQFYKKNGIDLVSQAEAEEFTIVRFEPFNMFRGVVPKRKELTLDFILEFIAKKEKVQYIDYAAIFKKLNISDKVGFYNTSYGIGVEVLFRTPENVIAKIEDYLKEKGIEYTNEYSEAGWVYRFKFSKSNANIDRILNLN